MLRLTGTLYCCAEMSEPWGIVLPRMVESMIFVVVTSGQAWIVTDGQEPMAVPQGSMVLFPQGQSVRLLSSPDAEAVPLFDIPVERISERYERMRHGGGGALTRATAGVVQFDHIAAKRLVRLLPPVLMVGVWSEESGIWLQSTLALIAREAAAMRPGGETMMTRLADILIIQALRAWLDTAPEANLGWLRALRDNQVGKALALIHRRPEHRWTLVDLARETGMSRSAFSARFTSLVGQPAAQYLTQWRLHLARSNLLNTSEPIAALATAAGYQSEAAFGRAFKHFFGVSPGSLRQRHQALGESTIGNRLPRAEMGQLA